MLILLILFVAGALTGLCFPPYSLWPILCVIYPFFCLIIIKSSRKRSAFIHGWCFGFGQFLASLYWVSLAFISPGIELGWALPFLMVGLPMTMAIYIGSIGFMYKLIRPQQAHVDLTAILLFTSLWSLAEVARGFLFTGFPWNLLGTVFWDTPLMQTLSIWGIYGLSFMACLVLTLPLLIKKNFLVGGIFPILIVGGMWWWGDNRLNQHPTAFHPGLNLRLVQGHIDQGLKWNPDLAASHLKNHKDLSLLPSDKHLTHIIWPETAVSSPLNQNENERKELSSILGPHTYLIVGGVRYDLPPFERLGNSLYVLNGQAEILAVYDKHHLIPFAEYVPYRNWIPFDKLAFGPIDYSAGDNLQTINVPGTPSFSPLICYEVIFPGEVVRDDKRPEWILNLTNDGWYGMSSGPYQHLQITRMRAIEEGLPLVRSTNTGISAIIDAYGRITTLLDLGKRGVIDGPLPMAIDKTIFAQGGKYSVGGLILISLLLNLLLWRRKGNA